MHSAGIPIIFYLPQAGSLGGSLATDTDELRAARLNYLNAQHVMMMGDELSELLCVDLYVGLSLFVDAGLNLAAVDACHCVSIMPLL